MPKLTKRVIDAAEIRAAEYFIWDNELPGFGLRMLPSGRKVYSVQYRSGRRSRRISLGLSSVLTCEQARTRAITIIAAVKNGEDPAANRDADRQAITVKELVERFEKEHVALRVKESTAKGYRRMLERVIVPALGRHRVTEVTRADVAKIHHDLRYIPTTPTGASRSSPRCSAWPKCGACVQTDRTRASTSRNTRRRSVNGF